MSKKSETQNQATQPATATPSTEAAATETVAVAAPETPEQIAKRKEKADKFVKLANKRVNRAIKATNAIATLSNKNSYSYTETQAANIVAALKKATDNVERKFGGNKEAESLFSL